MKQIKRELSLITIISLIMTFCLSSFASAQPMSSATSYILLYVDKTEAFLNDKKVTLESPATIIKDKMFVPAKFLGDVMGLKVEWNAATRQIEMTTPGYHIVLDSDHKSVWINGVLEPFDSVASISKEGKLLIKLTWLADYMGARYTYNDELRRVEIVHTVTPAGTYIPDTGNSKPVAKFAFGKSTYQLGEPVKYIDLSYDPDSEGIAKYEWKGNEETFFTAGTFPVTLTVWDKHGNQSETYLRYITIEDKTYLNAIEYPIYMKPVGAHIKTDWSMIWGNFWSLPQLPKKVATDDTRKLLVSDSPEEFKQRGILYQDKVNGKGRLYADHINGTQEKVTLAILARNNSDRAITIKTTNKGEVFPSVYANLIGNEASVDFLMNDPRNETLVVPAKQTFVYSQMPEFYPGQGVNLFYDVETDGEIEFSFVATDRITEQTLQQLPLLPFSGHVRGSFPVSEVRWDIDASAFYEPSRIIIGDGQTDPFQPGYDTMRKENVLNEGNYGVVYKIHAVKPRKMAIMIMPHGGVFKGPFKINGEMQLVPQSGVLTAFDGMQILAKTTGTEESLDIEFTPPAGSAFPIDLIFYPLADDKQIVTGN
ncbi:copper amine oxidase N-terminal domain-containing protein [Paenibacillus xerothermodurans]|uniref:Copper amine oxidase N-terminal domain-containing protein n=1 Tax=Paenibacillus xerothermodurans TaxID=1977292 RepID=A0A2W1N660_PAEXE|nr:copper amine oxidase N-terminal domain-containing protein [Paenibacillus xerothermodurans]PZE19314.1 copper amine oxidase N-terminal domain-containing protein [Paenibacillus xerothermodurans]